MPNTLYYGDNLTILREHIADASVDLIYLYCRPAAWQAGTDAAGVWHVQAGAHDEGGWWAGSIGVLASVRVALWPAFRRATKLEMAAQMTLSRNSLPVSARPGAGSILPTPNGWLPYP